MPGSSRPPRSWRDRARMTLEIIRANPTGRLALKVIVGLAGGLVVVIGLILVPLPGPGWLIVLLGLGILAIEFTWARYLLRFTRDTLRAWTTWISRQPWPVRLVVTAAGLFFVGAVAYLTLRIGFGQDVVAKFWHYLCTH